MSRGVPSTAIRGGVGSMLRALALAATCFAPASAWDQWAVLVAGSKDYYNYRHQADICHAYRTLMRRGVHPDRIITMLYDDVAHAMSNPFKGKLFNRPATTMADAVDVYAGCKKDYTGKDVSPEKFLAVLTGDARTAGGRVLRSGSEDHVFVNFVDHGGVGLISFPDSARTLHATELMAALKLMHQRGMFARLTFYLETCESGSMFAGLVPQELPIYAVTAANPEESSWGTFCGTAARVAGKNLDTCLGDLFEVNWIMDSETAASNETLGEQFKRVRTATNKSHVMNYGQVKAFAHEPVGSFEGSTANPGKGLLHDVQAAMQSSAVEVREIKLRMLYEEYVRTNSQAAAARLEAEVQDRRATQALGVAIAAAVVGGQEQAKALLGKPLTGVAGTNFAWTRQDAECHVRAAETFGDRCGWSENRLALSKALYQLCRHTGHDVAPVLAALQSVCGPKSKAILLV